jgi:integrase
MSGSTSVTRRRITKAKRPDYRDRYKDMHHFVLLMAKTFLRTDEALQLEFRDVQIKNDAATK